MKSIAIILCMTGLMPLCIQAITLSQGEPVKNSADTSAHFLLKGKIKGQKAGYLKLAYSVNEKYIQDSCAIVNGNFSFKGILTDPTMAYFIGNGSNSWDGPNVTTVFIEPGQMEMEVTEGAFKNLILRGSKIQDEYVAVQNSNSALEKELAAIRIEYDEANQAYIKANQEKLPGTQLAVLKTKAQELREKMDPYFEKKAATDLNYVKSHPNSYYAAFLFSYQVTSLHLDSSRKYYDSFSQKIKESTIGKRIAADIKSLELGSPGSVASTFSVKDMNGKQLSLNDFKGKKYVLLDFWASWCVPCRKGNPHLLSLYSRYKDKGLEIIGVSDDDGNLVAWKNAVEKDGIGVWKHVLRGLKQVGNNFDRSEDISDGFAIHSLPTKVLVDKNGIIIGRYGGGGEGDEAMDLKLAEIFK